MNMPLAEAVEVLRVYNQWRRDDMGEWTMPEPRRIRQAIDTVRAHFDAPDEPSDGAIYQAVSDRESGPPYAAEIAQAIAETIGNDDPMDPTV